MTSEWNEGAKRRLSYVCLDPPAPVLARDDSDMTSIWLKTVHPNDVHDLPLLLYYQNCLFL